MIKKINIQECLKNGYSSSIFTTLASLSFDKSKSTGLLYLSCIKKCKVTKGCMAITFRESSNHCWLKPSTDHKPQEKRSFLILSCLDNSGAKSTPLASLGCPKHFKNWIPSSIYCYRLLISPSFSVTYGQRSCKILVHRLASWLLLTQKN